MAFRAPRKVRPSDPGLLTFVMPKPWIRDWNAQAKDRHIQPSR